MYGFGQENDAETLLLHRFVNCVFEGEMHKNSIAALSDRGKVLVSGTVRRWGWRSFVISYYNDWLNMHGQINVLLAHLTASTKCTALSRVFIYIIQNQTQLGLNFILPHLFFFRLCNLFCPLLFSLPFGYYSSLKKRVGSVNLLTPLTVRFLRVCSCIMICVFLLIFICVLEHSCIFPAYGVSRESCPGINLRKIVLEL